MPSSVPNQTNLFDCIGFVSFVGLVWFGLVWFGLVWLGKFGLEDFVWFQIVFILSLYLSLFSYLRSAGLEKLGICGIQDTRQFAPS